MDEALEDQEGEVSCRVHQLIRRGRIPLPSAETIEISQKKRELEAVLRLLLRTYVALVCSRHLDAAAELLSAYRGLGEADLSLVFEQWGYPDEAEDGANSAVWLALARAVSENQAGDIGSPSSEVLSRVDRELVEEWQQVLENVTRYKS